MKSLRAAALLTLWNLIAILGLHLGSDQCLAQSPPQNKGGSASHIALKAKLIPADARAGEAAQVVLSAQIDAPYHMYSLTEPDGGSVRTTITLPENGVLAAAGAVVQPPYKSEFNAGFKITDQIYEGNVSYGIPVKIKPGIAGAQRTTVSIHFQLCDPHRCLLPQTVDVPVTFTPAPGAARPDHAAPITTVPTQEAAPQIAPAAKPGPGPTSDGAPGDQGLLPFLGLAVGAGFLALLTPCVFPMVPITVSFFAKRKRQSLRQGVVDALAYCAGIVSTFTVLGVGTAIVFKATGIRDIANNPYLNVALAILFVVLGFNLMGAFEIALPSSLANKAQAGTQRGGLVGPFLMGLTFTLTSFTCTVAFVGTLLAAAAQGKVFYPVVGMLAFSSAFALPFFLLAMFPQYLARLPKSGSWLVTVKAFMGFIELAAALKFLSNADLVWDKGLLTRPVFLAIWALIFVIAGLYMIGGLRLPNDDTAKIGWGRRSVGILTLLGGIFFLTGVNGGSLGKVSAYLPPQPYPGRQSVDAGKWLHDYDEALAWAKAGRPILINFTGANCTNCRDMEQNVFPRPEVKQELDKFVQVELYTDRDRPDDKRNAELLQKLTGSASLPVYVVLSKDGMVHKILQDRHSPTEFIAFLEQGRTSIISSAK